ncbi:MAG: hypothetical protein AB7D06_17030 [Pedobacter sp.]
MADKTKGEAQAPKPQAPPTPPATLDIATNSEDGSRITTRDKKPTGR